MEDILGKILIALFGALVGGFAKSRYDRRNEKKKAKTEIRPDVYTDFVGYFLALRTNAQTGNDFDKLRARLAIFGDSEVIARARAFLATAGTLEDSGKRQAFVELVKSMRNDMIMRTRPETEKAIEEILFIEESE